MKTIIQVWTHRCYNQPGYWGLGDALRGTIQTFMLCKKKGYRFYVDLSLHPIHKFLIASENPYSDLVQSKKDKIRMIPASKNLELKLNAMEDGIHCFFTNAHCTEKIDDECKTFIKTLLTPVSSLEDEIMKARLTIPYDSYSILHFRLGDQELVQKSKINISRELLRLIHQNKDLKSVLISDSNTLKNHPEVISDIFVLNTFSQHIGCSDEESIKDTLIDFFLITKSDKIKTYSCYNWVSGFVNWASKIYDIPLIKI
jgi:hypothetical protein